MSITERMEHLRQNYVNTKPSILTPEYSWQWVDREMDTFAQRPQDPYQMTQEQQDLVRREIFPYWHGKSLEEDFLAQLPQSTAHIAVDTGIIDNDFKWRQAVGEITPDYEDVLFVKGFGGLKREAEQRLAALDLTDPSHLEKGVFYRSEILAADAIITYARRYGNKARALASAEQGEERKQELVEALWIKLSEWVWTISSNTAGFFAGYNQFQNLTVGGKTRDGLDAANELSILCLEATDSVRTHQPGLSVRVQTDCSPEFLEAVCRLVSKGTGFPAIHGDAAGAQMLMAAGYEPEDARDWNNCGCVVPHFRKTGQWTSAVNVNFSAALEYALNQGRSRMTGERMGLPSPPPEQYQTFEAGISGAAGKPDPPFCNGHDSGPAASYTAGAQALPFPVRGGLHGKGTGPFQRRSPLQYGSGAHRNRPGPVSQWSGRHQKAGI